MKTDWTEKEDKELIKLHAIYGNKWAFLCKFFSGRTDNMIKNRWNTTLCKRTQSIEIPEEDLKNLFRTPKLLISSFSHASTDLGFSFNNSGVIDSVVSHTMTSLDPNQTKMIQTLRYQTIGKSHLLNEFRTIFESDTCRFSLALSNKFFTLKIPVFNRKLFESVPVLEQKFDLLG